MADKYRTAPELLALNDRARNFAGSHGRVFRPSQLAEWGLDPAVVRTMVRRRLWVRLRHGVDTDSATWEASAGDPVDRHLLHCAAAIRALPLAAYAFGRSAAALHALPVPRGQLGAVSLVRDLDTDPRALYGRVKSTKGLPDVAIKTHNLGQEAVTMIAGIPVVSRDLAAVSSAATSTHEWALATLDGAAWGRPAALESLARVTAEWPYLRGIGTVRMVLAQVRSGAQTPLESISRFRLTSAGLPEPTLQYPLHDRQGLIGYADMAWLDLGVIGECDGMLKYTSGDVLITEKLREDRIRALGLIVVRWTWDDVMRDPAAVADRIWRASRLATRWAI